MKPSTTLLIALALLSNVETLWSQNTLPVDVYPGLRTPDGALLPSVAGHLGHDITIRERSLDPDLLKRKENFGYSAEEIAKRFSAPPRMVLDHTGLDRSLIKPPPAPGVHPRVLFNPEDLPGIRETLEKHPGGPLGHGCDSKKRRGLHHRTHGKVCIPISGSCGRAHSGIA